MAGVFGATQESKHVLFPRARVGVGGWDMLGTQQMAGEAPLLSAPTQRTPHAGFTWCVLCRYLALCSHEKPGVHRANTAPRTPGTLRPRQACKGPTSSPISQKQKLRLRGVLGSCTGAELGPCLFRPHWSSLPPRSGPLQLSPTVSTSEPQPQLPCPFERAGSRPLLLPSLPFSRN